MKNRKRYPDEWHSNIRPFILSRDKFKCTRCGIKQRSYGYYDAKGKFIHCDEFMAGWARAEGLKVVRVWLQVAHLDQDSLNNDPANLACMCPKCHLRYDHQFVAAVKLGWKKK